MTLVSYIVPIVDTVEDNKTEIAKVKILVKSCEFGSSSEECDGWNFNHCPNDNDYCQPFIQGDKIYNQLNFDVKNYNISSVQIINQATEENIYSTSFVTVQLGRDSANNTYFNIVIDTANAVFNDVKCWYIKITLNPKQGHEVPTIYYTSEPYCIVQCNQDTMLITGEYPSGYDCFGGYYGTMAGLVLPGASIFKPSFRVPGVVEADEFDFEKTVSGKGKTIKSKQTKRFILYTQKIPYYVVQQIAICFNSKTVTIDGEEYTGTLKIQKNFEEGSMWILKENIYQECDEINFTCE